MTAPLWQSDGQSPLFLSAGAWHPLTLALNLFGLQSTASTVTYAIALLIFSAATSFVALRRYSASPSRGRWIIAALALTLAFLGTSSFTFVVMIVVLVLAATPIRWSAESVLGAFGAFVAALLLAAPWWLPMLIIGRERADWTSRQSARMARVHDFAPRVGQWFLPHAIVVRDDPETVRRFTTIDELATINHIPGKIARLSGGAFPSPGGGTFLKLAGGTLRVTAVRDGFDADVESNGWNVVVTNVPSWDGWRVYRSGDRLPPIIGDTAFLATFVPPGHSTIELRYRPDSLTTGVHYAVAGFALFLVTLIWPWPARFAPKASAFATFLRDKASHAAMPSMPRFPRLRIPPVTWRVLLALLVIAYAALLITHRCEVAGGADSSGYLNESRQWLTGKLRVELPLAKTLGFPPGSESFVIPLGYSPGPEHTMVPTYPSGLPLLMAFSRIIAGERGPFFVSPLLTTLGVLLLFQLARELGFSFGWAAFGAAIYAVCPITIFHGIQPMSDTVAGTFAIAAMLCAFRGATRPRFAMLAGALLGMGVLIRPTQILLFPAMLVAIGFNRRSLAALAAGGAPFAIFQMAAARHLYGSPFKTGYGSVISEMRWSYFVPRFKHYGYWLAAILSPVVFPIGLIALVRRDASARLRLTLALWFAAFFLFYCFYGPYETWWYTRFLVPALPSLILAALILMRAVTTSRLRMAALAVIAAAIFALQMAIMWHFDTLTFGEGERVYVNVAKLVEERVPKDAVVVSMQQSGALYYYDGRLSLRYDGLKPALFGMIRARDVHFYAAVGDWELDQLKESTGANWVPVAKTGDCYLLELR